MVIYLNKELKLRRAGLNKGFTLLELIVVMIIVAILAMLAFDSYEKEVEKGRAAEALANLGKLRKLSLVYYAEHESYPFLFEGNNPIYTDLPLAEVGANAGLCENDNYYFYYKCVYDVVGGGARHNCIATRCISGGKDPQGPGPYNISIDTESGVITQNVGACGGPGP